MLDLCKKYTSSKTHRCWLKFLWMLPHILYSVELSHSIPIHPFTLSFFLRVPTSPCVFLVTPLTTVVFHESPKTIAPPCNQLASRQEEWKLKWAGGVIISCCSCAVYTCSNWTLFFFFYLSSLELSEKEPTLHRAQTNSSLFYLVKV